MEQIRLKPYYSLIAHSPDVVELRHGVWNATSFTLTDENGEGTLYRLLRQLDGTRSPAEIAKSEGCPKADVEALIDHLTQLGVMEAGASTALDYHIAEMMPVLAGRDGSLVNASPDIRPIFLLGDPQIAAEIERSLKPSLPDTPVELLPEDDSAWQLLKANDESWLLDGVKFAEQMAHFRDWQDRFLVVASRTPHPVLLRNLNRVCRELGIPWIHATVDGPFLFVGPVILPDRSACYECLDTRVTMNLRGSASYQRYKVALIEKEIRQGTIPIQPVLIATLASLTAMEVLNYSLTGRAFTLSKLLSLYLPTMEFSFNEVLRVPGCPCCGAISESDEEQLYFDTRALYQ